MKTQTETFNPQSPSSLRVGPLATFDQSPQDRDLRQQIESLRAERDRLLQRQQQIAELLGSDDAEKIVHDVRNVLHELQLYKVLVQTQTR
jgi:hypothetical protein